MRSFYPERPGCYGTKTGSGPEPLPTLHPAYNVRKIITAGLPTAVYWPVNTSFFPPP
jgi:hypothetical protein